MPHKMNRVPVLPPLIALKFNPTSLAYFRGNYFSIFVHKSVSEVIKQEVTTALGHQSPNDFNTWFDDECADATER